MENFKSALLLILVSFLGFTSCEKSELTENTQDQTKAIITPGKGIDAVYHGVNVKLIEMENGKYLFGGDVILDRKDFVLPGETKVSARGTFEGATWTGKRIKWKYDTGVSETVKAAWRSAMSKWRTSNSFIFERVESTSSSQLLVIQENNSGVAYATSIGAKQNEIVYISIDPAVYSSVLVGSLTHELGHVLGLIHEHQRKDRDNSIIINYDNILPEWRYNFDVAPFSVANGTFDFKSIMLYNPYNGFAIDQTQPVFTKKDGTTWTPQTTYVSKGDAAAITEMYKNVVRQ